LTKRNKIRFTDDMEQTEAPQMTLTDQLVLVANTYSEATKTRLSTLGSRLLKSGGRFHAIAAGGDINTKNFEKTMQWFSDNWPSETAWPEGVTRPTPVPPPAEPALQATG
jgi:hypothetical protein